jgi:hypothetical protein
MSWKCVSYDFDQVPLQCSWCHCQCGSYDFDQVLREPL